MNNQKTQDLALGELKENAIQSVIDKAFKCKTEKLPPFFPYDFKDLTTNTYFEHKGRRNEYNKYPTTMIGQNKIDFANKHPDNDYVFIYGFSDNNYYIRYDKELFSSFEIKKGGRFDREGPEIKQYLYIPIEHLTKMY